jgi:thymidylate kinase
MAPPLESIDGSHEGFWLSIDGAEGVGKTTICRLLQSALPNAVLIGEFSSTDFGQLLSRKVTEQPHVFAESVLGQSCFFIGDFFMQHETAILPSLNKGKVVLSDRGYLSKFVYQLALMSDHYSHCEAEAGLLALFRLIRPPDMTIILTAGVEQIAKRLEQRDGSCDASRLKFIAKVQPMLIAKAATLDIRAIAINQEPEEAPCSVVAAVLEELKRHSPTNFSSKGPLRTGTC